MIFRIYSLYGSYVYLVSLVKNYMLTEKSVRHMESFAIGTEKRWFVRSEVGILYSQPLRPDVLLQKSFKGRHGANHKILRFRHGGAEISEGNN
jgi:hypothetical protein